MYWDGTNKKWDYYYNNVIIIAIIIIVLYTLCEKGVRSFLASIFSQRIFAGCPKDMWQRNQNLVQAVYRCKRAKQSIKTEKMDKSVKKANENTIIQTGNIDEQ